VRVVTNTARRCPDKFLATAKNLVEGEFLPGEQVSEKTNPPKRRICFFRTQPPSIQIRSISDTRGAPGLEVSIFSKQYWGFFIRLFTRIREYESIIFYMTRLKIVVFMFAIFFGSFMFVFGEYDDSPGAQLLGVILTIFGVVKIMKSKNKIDS
jgi:hypothetical protein